ncbi:MAG: class I SAM-dependent methyltransferase [Lachnospiraceae bacterium]|nr:class I SAM-dependent methyltransferase [Lachnospiraceae bacterium]
MKIPRKYGKSVGDIIKIKSDFFEKNDEMLKLSSHQADALLAQPKRIVCKICHGPIGADAGQKELYHSQRMSYYVCPVCGHVNSEYEDTEDFASRVYIADDYLSNYSESDRKNYETRRDTIYIPKAEFLIESLERDGLKKNKLRILDDGAGSGYFVSALRSLGIEQVDGIEISEPQVQFANTMNDDDILTQVDAPDIASIIETADVNVVTFIGVLEHITNLDEILSAVAANKKIRYIYFSVPMFSMSCVFEAAHQNCYNRHAGGTHTHLFTETSLAYMAQSIGFEEYATWKFGSDMMDLYRMICVCLDQNDDPGLRDVFSRKFLPMLDEMQEIIDRHEESSEIHMILKRKP